MGYASPLAATTTLLWEVLRIVDSEDGDNPVVAVEDSMTLVPKPGSAACWPSLYQARCILSLRGLRGFKIFKCGMQVLCNVLNEHGTVDEDFERLLSSVSWCQEGQKAILVSQLKPLLQRNWHNTFDEVAKRL